MPASCRVRHPFAGGMGADRERAPAPELGQVGALGLEVGAGRPVVDRGQRRPGARSLARHSTANAPWPAWGTIYGASTSKARPGGGSHSSRSRAARAVTTRDDAVGPDPGQPGGQVAAEVGEDEVRS